MTWNVTCLLERVLFLAFLTPELLFLFVWSLFLCFECTCVFPGAMFFFLRNIFKRNRWWKRLFFQTSAKISGTLQPKSLPLHLRIYSPALLDCLRGTWSDCTTLFPSCEGGVWSKFFDQVSEGEEDVICLLWPFFQLTFIVVYFVWEAEGRSKKHDPSVH